MRKKTKTKSKVKNNKQFILLAISAMVLLFSVIGLIGYLGKDSEDKNGSVSGTDVIDLGLDNINGESLEEIHEIIDDPSKPMLVIAHRGYCSVAPENTMQAFSRALDIGVDMIELDVQMTKDGYIVVFHDLNLSRIVGDKATISDYTYAELLNMDFGSYKSANTTGLSEDMMSRCYDGEHIATLDEVLAYMATEQIDSNVTINLELKDITGAKGISQAQKDIFAAAVVSRVYAYELQDRVIFASFNHDYLMQIEALNSENTTLYVTESGDADVLLSDYPADSYSIDLNAVTEECVNKIHENGKPVYVWTANSPEKMQYALSLGAEGVITNYSGIASVLVHDKYSFLRDHYASSLTAPCIYDYADLDVFESYEMTALTIVDSSKTMESYIESNDKESKDKAKDTKKTGDALEETESLTASIEPLILISAYDNNNINDSILYVMNANGVLISIVDLGINERIESLAYDADKNVLWITINGDKNIYALNWNSLCDEEYTFDIVEARENMASSSEDATNDNIKEQTDKPINALIDSYEISGITDAAFVSYDRGYLYVGSGTKLHQMRVVSCEQTLDDEDIDTKEKSEETSEKISEPVYELELSKTYDIPENIKGVTFRYEYPVIEDDKDTDEELEPVIHMIMTRDNGISNDSELLSVLTSENKTDYTSVDTIYIIPEMALQPCMYDNMLYLSFKSSSRPYLHSTSVANDQIWGVEF